MILHQDLESFKSLISFTAKDMGLLEFYIEKDYWVTYILKNLSKSSFKDEVVFKGGTSLSKGYNVINRFSEDIDLQLTNPNLSDNQKKRLLKNIEEEITKGMIYLENHPRESKRGNIRKTNREEFISKFELESFELEVLSIKRTFMEKIFAILDYTFEKNPEEELGNKIRHLYDIYKLSQVPEIKEFFYQKESFEMASKVVVQNDFFGKRKDIIYRNSFLYTDLDRVDKIEITYNTKFIGMVSEKLPDFKDLKNTLREIIKFIAEWEEKYR